MSISINVCDFNDVLEINCGESNPRLGGAIDNLKIFPNLQNFICVGNDIFRFPTISSNKRLRYFNCSDNKIEGALPDISENTDLELFKCNINKISGGIPNLSLNTKLVEYTCNQNLLTGPIPELSSNVNLVRFACYDNLLTGVIPKLTQNINLTAFRCSNAGGLTGNIPSLSENKKLTLFRCNDNLLTGFDGGSIPNTLKDFRANNNNLTAEAVNSLLREFVVAGAMRGYLSLEKNAAPSGQGLIDLQTLRSRQWQVST